MVTKVTLLVTIVTLFNAMILRLPSDNHNGTGFEPIDLVGSEGVYCESSLTGWNRIVIIVVVMTTGYNFKMTHYYFSN